MPSASAAHLHAPNGEAVQRRAADLEQRTRRAPIEELVGVNACGSHLDGQVRGGKLILTALEWH